MKTRWINNSEPIDTHIECIDILLNSTKKAVFDRVETKESLIELLEDLKTVFLVIKNEDSTK